MKLYSEKHTFQDVKEAFSSYITNQNDIDRIEKAYLYALKQHEGQFRHSGEPYIIHAIEVCYILATLNAGPSTLVAGFLHDTVEDTSTTLDDIKNLFGEDIALLVDGVTKIQELSRKSRDSELVAEGHRKIFIATAHDIRVIIIKLADRLHNMRTLNYVNSEKQKRIAKETLDVYAPIAHRLGIHKVKSELEDLSLYYLEREKYEEIENLLNERSIDRKKAMMHLQKKIADMLISTKIPFTISSRVKEIYSIYKKMYFKGRKFDEIYDIMAMRIITETELNCYEILGYIHSIYVPVPGRFKDYIAMPKPNMYQSLHTTILTQDGNIFEIQIRTKKMDEIAEGGVAAHWRYKEGKKYDAKKEQKEIEEKLHWFRDFVSMTDNETESAKEYMSSLTHDIFDANVYVFTPKGKLIELPEGSTPIDFAYKIHSGVGDSAVGAKVNNSLVPLSTKLKTGDIIEIKTSKVSSGPNESWLQLVKTSNAKNHIRKFLIKKNQEFMKDDSINKAKSSIIEAFKEHGLSDKDFSNYIDDKFISKFSYNSIDEFLYGVSQKNPPITAVIDALNIRDKLDKTSIIESVVKKHSNRNNMSKNQDVIVSGVSNIKIQLAPCCTPIPGDEIVGYITRGKGIKVHRKDCPNIQNEVNRTINVDWNPSSMSSTFTAHIQIEANDRPNLIVDVMNTLSSLKITCTKFSAKVLANKLTSLFDLSILVTSNKRLFDVFSDVKSIEGVYDVRRVIK